MTFSRLQAVGTIAAFLCQYGETGEWEERLRVENETEKGDGRYGPHVQYHCSVLESHFKMCL